METSSDIDPDPVDETSWFRPKWRPALWMVVFGVLVVVALLPIIGLLLLLLAEKVFGFSFELRSSGGMITLAIGSVIVALAIGAVFLRTLLRPLHELIARTDEIDAGNSNAFRPLEQGGTREVAALGERFFKLARRLSDRSNYLTMFTTHVSHELKTPLTSILGAAELLRESGDSMNETQRRRFLNNITEDSARLAALSNRLRELAHAEVANTSGHSALLPVLKHSAEQALLDLEVDDGVDVVIAMSEPNSAVVWQQLTENAVQNGAGRFLVRIENRKSKLIVHVGDDGRKISKANRAKIFEPFFTTRREQGGTGMGLGIARAMLMSHGGDLAISEDDRFKFVLQIPLHGK